MIGFIDGVGRMAFSNAIRQIGRQFGREAMERIMRGEAIEDVLTRDQLRELAKKTGKLALDELMRIGKEEFKKDIDKKQEDLNKNNGQLW
jgi:hypothetical protein